MPVGVYKRTKEMKEKNKIAHLKENLSDETLEKMRLSHLGKSSFMKGKHFNEEFKEKDRLSHLNQIPWNKGKKTGQIPWNKGKIGIYSEEYREKLSKAAKGRRLTKETLRKILCKRPLTNLEVNFQSIVDKYNLPYKYVGDGSFIIDCYCPDFINTNNEKIAVEVYAKYFKKKSMSIEDWKIQRAKVFKQYGWEIIFFNETEVNEENILNKLNEVNK